MIDFPCNPPVWSCADCPAVPSQFGGNKRWVLIWRFPEIGVPLVIIHFGAILMGFSMIDYGNHHVVLKLVAQHGSGHGSNLLHDHRCLKSEEAVRLRNHPWRWALWGCNMSSVHNPCWLMILGDYTTQYIGSVIIQERGIPINQPV